MNFGKQYLEEGPKATTKLGEKQLEIPTRETYRSVPTWEYVEWLEKKLEEKLKEYNPTI